VNAQCGAGFSSGLAAPELKEAARNNDTIRFAAAGSIGGLIERTYPALL